MKRYRIIAAGARCYAISAALLATLMLSANVERSHSLKLRGQTIAKIEQQATDAIIPVFIRVAPGADMQALAKEHGVKWNVAAGEWHTALVATKQIEALAAEPDIVEINAGADVRPMCDEMRQLTGVETLYNGIDLPTTYRGKGVIVGIIDNGFDFSHPNFTDADGNCRIATVWDQNSFAATATEYGYGAVYSTAEEIATARHDNSSDTHGTHVLGIAAGGSMSQYRGVAPEAEIAIVSTNKTEAGILDGLDFLIKYAEAQGKPLSVNLSYGTVLDYKDGSSALAQGIDKLLAEHPQCLMAIAAGNEGNRNANIYATEQISTILQMPSYGRENLFVEGAAGKNYTMTIKLVDGDDTLMERTVSTNKPENFTSEDFGSGTDYKSLTVAVASDVDCPPAIQINILYYAQGNEKFEITVSPEDNAPFAIYADYGELVSGGKQGFVDGSKQLSIASTACGREPIAVAAYTSRTDYTNLAGNSFTTSETMGERYSRSGQGPTFDQRTRPEIAAPGAAIISSFNSFAATYSVAEADKVYKTTSNSRTYTWGVMSGTSMATPVVTGALALLQEVNPDITLAEARTLILDNAVYATDAIGKIDILASVKAAIEANSSVDISIDSANGNHDIFDLMGRKMDSSKALAPGIYIRDGRKFIVRRN